MTDKNKKVILCTAGAVVAPLIVMSLYLTFSRWPVRIFTAWSDYLFLGLSLVVGGVLICLLPFKISIRTVIIFSYILVGGWLLTLFSLQFVGIVFGDWL